MADQNINNMSVTWNSGGTTFNAVKMNVTDTASAAASLLFDFQVGGTSKIKVRKDGLVTLAAGLILSAAAGPTPTTEGQVEWDSDDDHFAVGDGTNTIKPGKLPTVQTFASTGTWTKPAGCRAIIVEGVGGGGGAGGVTGSATNYAGSGGGGSGFFGKTNVVSVTLVSSGAVTIGAGGAGGVGASAGGTGGTTSIVIGATTYDFPGGDGSPGDTANAASVYYAFPGTYAAASINVRGSSTQGQHGLSSRSNTFAVSGYGAPSPYGIGADKQTISGASHATGLSAAANTGGGGGGAVSGDGVTVTGGAGGSGYLRVWEYY